MRDCTSSVYNSLIILVGHYQYKSIYNRAFQITINITVNKQDKVTRNIIVFLSLSHRAIYCNLIALCTFLHKATPYFSTFIY